MSTWKRTDLHGAEYRQVIEDLLRVLPDGATMADANKALSTVLNALPDARPAGVKEIAESWGAKRSTAMERIRRLQADGKWIAPAGDVAAATLYDMADVEALDWAARPSGRMARA